MSFTILPGQKWSDQYEQLKFLMQQEARDLQLTQPQRQGLKVFKENIFYWF